MGDYNGWKNYETWCVKLWVDNDQGEQELWLERTHEAWTRANGDADDARAALASTLKDYFEEAAPRLDGIWADLINAAVSEVDWYEIAAEMIEDADCEPAEVEADG